MDIKILTIEHITQTTTLYGRCFCDDKYFEKHGFDFSRGVPDSICRDIQNLLPYHKSYGVFDDELLVGFMLVMPNHIRTTNPRLFNSLFGIMPECDVMPYKTEILDRIPETGVYLVAAGIEPAYRRHGIYKMLFDQTMWTYGSEPVASDISNLKPLQLYISHGFQVFPIEDDYDFILHT